MSVSLTQVRSCSKYAFCMQYIFTVLGARLYVCMYFFRRFRMRWTRLSGLASYTQTLSPTFTRSSRKTRLSIWKIWSKRNTMSREGYKVFRLSYDAPDIACESLAKQTELPFYLGFSLIPWKNTMDRTSRLGRLKQRENWECCWSMRINWRKSLSRILYVVWRLVDATWYD